MKAKMKFAKLLSACVVGTLVLRADGAGMESKLWYDKPATNWETEALPIGNGRLGAMIFGGASGLFPNLFDAHPPFQIDGNFGYTAGVCEMLLQSHAGEIHLLPALPKAWPTGEVTGLSARGNLEVDIRWQNGKLVQATLHPKQDGSFKVRCGDKVEELKLKAGRAVIFR